jgi:exopolyphosphatase/guanosine-5'-triphosphate,3'-diphosphate pyrophosphatase
MSDEVRATGPDPVRERSHANPSAQAEESEAGGSRSGLQGGRGSPKYSSRVGRGQEDSAPHDGARRELRADSAAFGTDLYGPTYAALDLGTNNCRLLVARATHEGFRVIDAFSRIIRLGEGITATGRLGEPAIGRAIEVLRICRDKMRNRGVTRARLIATEACRQAENGTAFLDRVREEVGISLEIVDRETEAMLAAIGCTPLVDPEAEGAILFDIGGGSSEIASLGRPKACRNGPPEPAMRCCNARRAAWRYHRHARNLRDHGSGGRRSHRAVRAGAWQASDQRASARNLRHRDHHCRGASWAEALRSPPGRRLLDDG